VDYWQWGIQSYDRNSGKFVWKGNYTRVPCGVACGERVLACKQGMVILEGGLELKNVLYVPNLKWNLLSVPQLTDEENCVVKFTDKLCIM